MKFFERLERKYRKYAIKNLMTYIIVLYALGWFITVVNPALYDDVLSLDVQAVLNGQVWRLVTFIILPPQNTNMFFIFFSLYLYYMIGNSLENAWGSFKFNIYFFTGVLLNILTSFIIYFVFGFNYPMTTYYLNMSLLLAFAAVYPNMEFLLFFLIPIKVKWIGILDAVFLGATIFFGFAFQYFPLQTQVKMLKSLLNVGIIPIPECAVAALVSVLNFIVFFLLTRNYKRLSPKEIRRKKSYHKQVKRNTTSSAFHKCDICGRTSEDHPELSFRYCSKCSGNHEYCQDHLFTHEHIK